MRILYLITKSEIGGAQVHVRDLMKSMVREGHSVALMSFPGGFLEDEAKNLGVKFYSNTNFSNSFNPFNALKAILNIRKVVKDFLPDLVSLHSSSAGFLGRLAIRGRIPTIFTAHGFAFTDGASIVRKIIAVISEKIVAKYAYKIICVSDLDRKLALKCRIAQEEKLITIYNGVDPVCPVSTSRENIIIAVGRLAYQKHYSLLLDAYKKANLFDIRLEIIGDGPDRLNIEDKIKKNGLKDKVLLLGNMSQQDVRARLALSKIFILISRYEGFPLSILEAMSAGLPVIASNVGGISEEIDSTCGILVANDKEEIANAIKTLSKEETQKKMGAAAQKRFEENFTLNKFLEATKKVYRDVVKF